MVKKVLQKKERVIECKTSEKATETEIEKMWRDLKEEFVKWKCKMFKK